MIYKLKYINKEAALKDLKSKKVIDTKEQNINGTEAVVECGIINDGYHYDIMTTDEILFESEVFPNNPKYKFGGHE